MPMALPGTGMGLPGVQVSLLYGFKCLLINQRLPSACFLYLPPGAAAEDDTALWELLVANQGLLMATQGLLVVGAHPDITRHQPWRWAEGLGP